MKPVRDYKVLVVDDEPLAREGTCLLLQAESDMQVIGQCGNGSEAIRSILEKKPDLVFLDIKMPRVGGFDVIEAIGPENMPPVVFLTAYDEHAVAAFEVRALDYLLKPIETKRFKRCLERVRESLRKDEVEMRAKQLKQLLVDGSPEPAREDRLVVRTAGHVHFLKPAEIAWVEAGGDYVTLHVGERQHLLRDTMLNMEKRLKEHGFRRIHRSLIVNLQFIAELIANESGDYDVILTTDVKLKLSRSYRDELYAALQA